MADQLRAAAQQALEFVTSEQWGTVPYMRGDVYSDAQKLEDDLRAALAQAEPVQSAARVDAYDMIDRFLRNNLRDDDYAEYSAALDSLYTAPQQQAEPVQPVAWADKISFENAMNTGKGHDVWPNAGDYETRTGRALIGLYTAPLQRKPLTEEEIYEMYNEPRSDAEMVEFARAIERAHGIKEAK